MVGRPPDREVILHLLKDRSRSHIGPFPGPFRDPAEERPFARREPRGPDGEHRRSDRPGCGHDVAPADPASAVSLRPETCLPDKVDPDPDVLFVGGDAGDAVEERRRHYSRIEPLLDTVAKDLADLSCHVRREEDLDGMKDRPDPLIGLGVEVQRKIATDRKDSGLCDVSLLVEPEDLVEEEVIGPRRDEVVRVVEADEEPRVFVVKPGSDPLLGGVEVPPSRRRRVAEELLKDASIDCKRCVVVLAVDVDRGHPASLRGDRGKDPADRGGLPGPGRAAEDGAPHTSASEGRPDEEGEFPDLGVAVVEVLGEIRELESLTVPKKGLVGAEKGRGPHRSLWRRGSS